MRLSDDGRAILAEQEADAREWSDAEWRWEYERWAESVDAADLLAPELAAAPGADGGGGTAEFPW